MLENTRSSTSLEQMAGLPELLSPSFLVNGHPMFYCQPIKILLTVGMQSLHQLLDELHGFIPDLCLMLAPALFSRHQAEEDGDEEVPSFLSMGSPLCVCHFLQAARPPVCSCSLCVSCLLWSPQQFCSASLYFCLSLCVFVCLCVFLVQSASFLFEHSLASSRG